MENSSTTLKYLFSLATTNKDELLYLLNRYEPEKLENQLHVDETLMSREFDHLNRKANYELSKGRPVPYPMETYCNFAETIYESWID